MSLGTAVAAGCGVLIPWTTNSFVSPMSTDTQATWSTRAVAFDGPPLGPLQSYPFLQAPLNSGAGIEIAAASDGTVGALMTDMTGSTSWRSARWSVAGVGGRVDGAIVHVACVHRRLVSFLSALAGSRPTTLVTLDAEGSTSSSTPLGDPAGWALCYRLVFGDGSFLDNRSSRTAETRRTRSGYSPRRRRGRAWATCRDGCAGRPRGARDHAGGCAVGVVGAG